MLHKDEINILRIIRLAPAFVVILSVFAIFFIVKNNNTQFNKEVEQLKFDSIAEKKSLVKSEVLKVHDFISHQKAQSIEKIKANLQERVKEAHAIASALYQNNQDKKPDEIKKLISDALRDIRFNQGRGYFFVYQTDGLSVMHPILPHLQTTNLWDFTDIKGRFVIRELSKIATEEGEGFLRWWWRKPTDTETEYEKIGYSKHFAPFNWFIGTGDYVLDYEEELKASLLKSVNHIKYSKDGYVFVIDKSGTYLSHYKKAYIGKNRINLVDDNGFEITKNLLKAANAGEDFISYIGTIRPSTGLPGRKISFVKGFSDWQWAIGSGAYLDDIDRIITDKKIALDEKYKQKLLQASLIGGTVTIVLFIISLVFANAIKRRFEAYKLNVNEKRSLLNALNRDLENKVISRTTELTKTNNELEAALSSLKQTQVKLIESEKMSSMVNVVSGIAHELNSPLGVMLTSISQIENKVERIFSQLKAQKLSKKELLQLEDSSQIGFELLNRNLDKAIQLVQHFKSLSMDSKDNTLTTFSITELIQLLCDSYQGILKNHQVSLQLNLTDNTLIKSNKAVLTEVLSQLIDNSLLHAFTNTHHKIIAIEVTHNTEAIIINYQDNGQGLCQQGIKKIFEPFYTTKRSTNCTGLGMPIVYNQINYKLQGNIQCEPALPTGLKFIIRVPLAT